MERKAVVVSTAVDAGDFTPSLDFAEFCAEWLSRHCEDGIVSEVTLLHMVESARNVESAKSLLMSLSPSFEKRSIKVEILVRVGSAERLASEINSLKPEVVFLTGSKLAKRVKENSVGLLVEYPDSRQRELKASEAYGVAALLLYAAIFASSGVIRGILLQKSFVSVALILGIVLAVAYIYGNTVSHALKYLGIKSRHAR